MVLGERSVKIAYDEVGVPALFAPSPVEAHYGIGFLHGLFRPLQTLILACAARGHLSELVAPKPELVAIDALARRLDIVRHGERAARALDEQTASWLDAYLSGVQAGLAEGGAPIEFRLLRCSIPPPDRVSVLSGLMLSSYLGLAEGQERMERALVEVVRAGADVVLLRRMFAPHLEGFVPDALRPVTGKPGLGFSAARVVATAGGSNAWAVTGARTASGRAILCGDPHLQLNQLPSLFFELRARVGDDVWLGATIPGLPGLAMGRTKHLAFSGTFSVADNVDFSIEEVKDGVCENYGALAPRRETVQRRFGEPLELTFYDTSEGTLEDGTNGTHLHVRWAGRGQDLARSLHAYLRLALATSAVEGEQVLGEATAFALHYVLADAAGDIRYVQAGRIPRRVEAWSGLYPSFGEAARWHGFHEGDALPRARAIDDMIVSANEGRRGPEGATLSTLAQPSYRRERIETLLARSRRHDATTMQAIQVDLYSLQAERLLPYFIAAASPPLAAMLRAWDRRYDEDSLGAHAFELCYRAATLALAPDLGGDAFMHLHARTELPVWWCDAIDRVLAGDETWQGTLGARLRRAVAAVRLAEVEPWGDVQRFTMNHMIFGGIGRAFGFDRGPMALPGCRATVRQGNLLRVDGNELAVGPAYRFVCDFADDGLWTSLPGGVDGSRFGDSYDRWLSEWQRGQYHRLVPPSEAELRSARPV